MKPLRLILSLALLLSVARMAAFPLTVAGIDTTRTAVWIYDLRWDYDVVNANIDRSLVPTATSVSPHASRLAAPSAILRFMAT